MGMRKGSPYRPGGSVAAPRLRPRCHQPQKRQTRDKLGHQEFDRASNMLQPSHEIAISIIGKPPDHLAKTTGAQQKRGPPFVCAAAPTSSDKLRYLDARKSPGRSGGIRRNAAISSDLGISRYDAILASIGAGRLHQPNTPGLSQSRRESSRRKKGSDGAPP